MSKEKNNNKIENYKVVLSDNDSEQPLWDFSFTRLQAIVAAITAIVVFCALIFALIAFTPLRTAIPGYPDANTRRAAVENAVKVDSLESEIMRWEFYTENLRRVVEGKEPMKIDSLLKVDRNSTEMLDRKELARKDSILRQQVTKESEFELSQSKERALPIEGMHFFSPVKGGVISQGYDALHPFVDVTAPKDAVVMAVLDGTVISSGWSDEYGYTIQIQHEGDIISIYKHNEKLMKKTGDKVTAGMPIAVVGNTGSTSDGKHLHFELWHKGEAVDPTKYISF